jgi:hypothetical protein
VRASGLAPSTRVLWLRRSTVVQRHRDAPRGVTARWAFEQEVTVAPAVFLLEVLIEDLPPPR